MKVKSAIDDVSDNGSHNIDLSNVPNSKTTQHYNISPPTLETKMKDGSDNGSNQHMDPTIISNVPKAMFQKYSAGEPITSEPPVVAEHRALFMQRAFGTGNEAHKQLADNMHDSDSRESSVRHENELENICYILKHWGGDINLKEIHDDEILRKKLSKFRRDHAVGKHHVGKYHFHEITLPSGERRNILRRIERGEVGRIVVSRERIFDDINEWHRGGVGHLRNY